MSIPTTQKAVVIEGAVPVVKEGLPVPEIPEGCVLVKVEAAAGNPTDWKHIAYGIGPQGSILGCDLAGTIVKFGPNTSSEKFRVGDTVYGFVHGASVKYPENGAFAEYARAKLDLLYKGNLIHESGNSIPMGAVTTFEGAASLPVSLTTAGMILYHNLKAKLDWNPSEPTYDFPLLIWGGATAVGIQLIQLAKQTKTHSKILVVASNKHEAFLKNLGVDQLFDYHDADVIDQIKSSYPDILHVVDGVSEQNTLRQCYKVTSDQSPATVVQLTNMTVASIPESERKSNVAIDGTLLYLAANSEVPFGSVTIPANPEYAKAASKFIAFINSHVEAGEIQHMPIHVFPNGLADVPELTNGIKEGKNSGVKYVTRL